MSGFSVEWLRLREGADHRARNAALLRTTANLFADRAHVRVTDLGCGTGSNLRAMAQSLPHRQEWRLVDHDDVLLAQARTAFSAWADFARTEGDRFVLRKDAHTIDVIFERADLAKDCEEVVARPADLVTASGLIDLVSAAWIERLVASVATQRAPFYTALAYNGVEAWTPPHSNDTDMHAAFLAHQAGDKGFGPAAGPQAAQLLADAFARADYDVTSADSAWVLEGPDAPLIRELASGVVHAVEETARVPAAAIHAWREARLTAAACTIGHTDILAVPKR